MNSKDWILISGGDCNTPKKKKKKEGYLSKFVYGVIFIIDISKGFSENKVETLAIYKLIISTYMKRYFERGDYRNYSNREGLTA